MIQIVQPDFKIEIGIKDGEVISVNWSEMLNDKNHIKDKTNKIKKSVLKYLDEALIFMIGMPSK